MIPRNITVGHVLKAIREIARDGVPAQRQSKDYILVYEGDAYPPKYVVSLANKYANGSMLSPDSFSGGRETNDLLVTLGFEVREKHGLKPPVAPQAIHHVRGGAVTRPSSNRRHNERCAACKRTVRDMLERICGEVQQNYQFRFGTVPGDFSLSPMHAALEDIYRSLQNHRGHRDFVQSEMMPRVDYFVPSAGLIVEFDESQHFTVPRRLALAKYPSDLETGYDMKRWMQLCDEIDAHDDTPPCRDEQRAWYDTLRDLIPAMAGLAPTVRLYAKDAIWCDLSPGTPGDIERFRGLLMKPCRGSNNGGWRIETRQDPTPFLGRIIMTGEWHGRVNDAQSVLEAVCGSWAGHEKLRFVMSPGGFVQFDWPAYLSVRKADILNPPADVIAKLIGKANETVSEFLGGSLAARLSRITDYMTLGVDSYKEEISTTQQYIGRPHIELVCLVDVGSGKRHWTGKSYPTPSQQRGLVRIADLKTHFLELPDAGQIMILGCHDLTIYNNRNWEKTGGWRKDVKMGFRKLARERRPTIALQHPHTTDSVYTWASAWSTLTDELASVRVYAGAGRYHRNDDPGSERSPLYDVLRKTKRGPTVDFIIRPQGET